MFVLLELDNANVLGEFDDSRLAEAALARVVGDDLAAARELGVIELDENGNPVGEIIVSPLVA